MRTRGLNSLSLQHTEEVHRIAFTSTVDGCSQHRLISTHVRYQKPVSNLALLPLEIFSPKPDDTVTRCWAYVTTIQRWDVYRHSAHVHAEVLPGLKFGVFTGGQNSCQMAVKIRQSDENVSTLDIGNPLKHCIFSDGAFAQVGLCSRNLKNKSALMAIVNQQFPTNTGQTTWIDTVPHRIGPSWQVVIMTGRSR